MKYILLIFFCFSNLLSGFDLISTNQEERYIICKRPLSFLPINIDIEKDEVLNANLQHFHFFEINNKQKVYSERNNSSYLYVEPEYGLFDIELNLILYKLSNHTSVMKHIKNGYVEVDEECQNKYFKNFGYFNNNNVKCNEEIENFPYCSTKSYDKEVLLKVFDEILGDSKYKQYDFIKYNCQTFVKNLIEAYKYKLNGVGVKGEACYICNNCTNKYQSLPNEKISKLIKLTWEKNPLYSQNFFLKSFRLKK